ncbi:hypothetical protein WJX81_005993 [Elliptochloris bilobata]|uniref:Glycosyltransferase subfamily 4-like N-terminal domain-containing protein n=1 Tax=Elliptochloris bilobata TaxID=381761 RepID=A0AAW1QAM1_9CHLO
MSGGQARTTSRKPLPACHKAQGGTGACNAQAQPGISMAQLKAEGRAPLAVLCGGNGVHKARPAAHSVAVQASAALAAPPDVPVLPAPATPPKNVFVFIEPSPFSHVSGMKIRFSNLIKGLREVGDDVTVVTPCINPPRTFHGAKVVSVLGFSLPFYNSPTLLLSLGLSVRVLWRLLTHRPDVIHVSSPGFLVFAATLYAKLLAIPLVVSYHTHIPEYIPMYTWKGLVEPMWKIIRFNVLMADLTLVPSKTMKLELARNRCRSQRIDVWQQAVDTDVFNPVFRSADMRARMSGGRPDAVILTYVGRLGAEKNLEALKGVLQSLADTPACLCFVGDGPARRDLERHFEGLPVYFTGMLKGEELSSAYASADVFVMPSETETLGFVALEAMASGLPVVAVAAGGLVDIVTQPGVIGHLYASGDYARAAALTRGLVVDEGARVAMGAAARAHVEKLGWQAAIRRIRDQYQRAIHTFRAHKRFRWVAIRVFFTRMLHALVAAVQWLVNAVVYRLDYARRFRPRSTYG